MARTPNTQSGKIGQPAINTGDSVFLESGQEAEFVAALPEGVVVRPIFESEDDEPRYGKPFTVREVFAEPPVAKFHEECERLAEMAAESRAKITAARDEWAAFERDEADRRIRVQTHEAIKRLDDFLSGRITHVIVEGYGPPEIKPFDDYIANRNDRGQSDGLKLLTLFGRSKGNLLWGVNRYSDGSGGNTTVHPATSEDEAKAIVQEIWDAAMEGFRAKTGYMHGFNYYVDAAPRLGLHLPPDLALRWFEHAVVAGDEAVAKAGAELEAQRQRTAALRQAADLARSAKALGQQVPA